MTILTSLDLMYIVLTIFIAIIGTLLAIVLIRLIKVLGMATEIVDYYNKFKELLASYAKIPSIVKEKVKEIIKKEDK